MKKVLYLFVQSQHLALSIYVTVIAFERMATELQDVWRQGELSLLEARAEE